MENGTFIDVLPIKKADFHSYVELPGYVVNTREPQKPRWTAHLLLIPVGKANRSSSPIKSHETNCAAWYKTTKFQFLGGNLFPYLFNICETISWGDVHHFHPPHLRSRSTSCNATLVWQLPGGCWTSTWLLSLSFRLISERSSLLTIVEPKVHVVISNFTWPNRQKNRSAGQPCIFLWFGLQPIC